MEKNKTQRLPAPKKAIKPQPQCVSNSEAASGPHTSYQGTDALANLPGSRNKPTRTPDPHPRGWVRRAGNTPRLARRLSFHILSSPVKKEYGPRRAPARLYGRNLKRRGYQPRKKSPNRPKKGAISCCNLTPPHPGGPPGRPSGRTSTSWPSSSTPRLRPPPPAKPPRPTAAAPPASLPRPGRPRPTPWPPSPPPPVPSRMPLPPPKTPPRRQPTQAPKQTPRPPTPHPPCPPPRTSPRSPTPCKRASTPRRRRITPVPRQRTASAMPQATATSACPTPPAARRPPPAVLQPPPPPSRPPMIWQVRLPVQRAARTT